jgi:hypothetical protein
MSHFTVLDTDLSPVSKPPPDPSQRPRVVELASGIDALYLSGQTPVSESLRSQLEIGRAAAVDAGEPQPFSFGNGNMFEIAHHGWRKYPYLLAHPNGLIGIKPDSLMPPVRVQPRAEFLHGVGPLEAARWFEDVLEWRMGRVTLSVNRLDLHGDFQGWDLGADDRERFVCRARSRTTYEDDGRWTGFIFGARKSGTVNARIYDKTEQLKQSRAGYWEDIWGSKFDSNRRVVRVEFEMSRGGLSSFGLSSPEDVVEAAGALWMHLTSSWLSYRVRTDDATRSRWPLASEWEQVQRAYIANDAHGIERMVAGRRRATLQGVAPSLVGYLASYAALVGTEDIDDTCETIPSLLRRYAGWSGRELADRVAEKAKGL